MASEIQASFQSGKTLYALIRGYSTSPGLIWNAASLVTYVTANYSTYVITMAEQGTASAFYTGTFPATLAAGTYSVTVKQQLAGSPAETDPTVAAGNIEWNGSNPAPLSDTATSGQIGQLAPIRLARGVMVKNFPFKMVSSADHITPLTSGIISGQISKDGGSFAALQSGAFTEVGLGWFSLQALTSGDLLCNTAGLVFTGAGISGGAADNRDFALVLQRTSGQL